MTLEETKAATEQVDLVLKSIDESQRQWDSRRKTSVRQMTGVRVFDVRYTWGNDVPVKSVDDNEPVKEMFVSHDKPVGMRIWIQLTEGDSHVYAIQPHETVWVFVEQAA